MNEELHPPEVPVIVINVPPQALLIEKMNKRTIRLWLYMFGAVGLAIAFTYAVSP